MYKRPFLIASIGISFAAAGIAARAQAHHSAPQRSKAGPQRSKAAPPAKKRAAKAHAAKTRAPKRRASKSQKAAANNKPASSPSQARGPSCNGKPGAGNDCQGRSCCDRIRVPGGKFQFAEPGAVSSHTASVASFYLDRYETTVGRFKAWADAGAPLPKIGAVLQKDLNGKPIVWTTASSRSTQRGKNLAGWDKYDTWTARKYRAPKNSINWYTAAAFCHWDGGRLPTEKEWQYAAVGGDQARRHPWGDTAPSYAHAVYNCHGDGDKSCDISDLLAVGSKPKGAGRWGHMDLAGSIFEWSVTYQGTPDRLEGRSNGGGFCYIGGVDRRAPLGLKATTARVDSLTEVGHTVGARCAYDIKPRNKAAAASATKQPTKKPTATKPSATKRSATKRSATKRSAAKRDSKQQPRTGHSRG